MCCFCFDILLVVEVHSRRFYILVRRNVLRRTPRTVAPDAYWISLRIPFHFLSVSSNLSAGENSVTEPTDGVLDDPLSRLTSRRRSFPSGRSRRCPPGPSWRSLRWRRANRPGRPGSGSCAPEETPLCPTTWRHTEEPLREEKLQNKRHVFNVGWREYWFARKRMGS